MTRLVRDQSGKVITKIIEGVLTTYSEKYSVHFDNYGFDGWGLEKNLLEQAKSKGATRVVNLSINTGEYLSASIVAFVDHAIEVRVGDRVDMFLPEEYWHPIQD